MVIKYPFIKDKDIYAATMFACKILKNGSCKSFTDACKKAARYYSADLESVITEVRKRRAVTATLHAKGRKSADDQTFGTSATG